MMLYMIAQPTRKEPERLPRYEDLYEERLAGYGKTGEEILLELVNG